MNQQRTIDLCKRVSWDLPRPPSLLPAGSSRRAHLSGCMVLHFSTGKEDRQKILLLKLLHHTQAHWLKDSQWRQIQHACFFYCRVKPTAVRDKLTGPCSVSSRHQPFPAHLCTGLCRDLAKPCPGRRENVPPRQGSEFGIGSAGLRQSFGWRQSHNI